MDIHYFWNDPCLPYHKQSAFEIRARKKNIHIWRHWIRHNGEKKLMLKEYDVCVCVARRKFYVVLELAAIIGVDMLHFWALIVVVPFISSDREYALKHHRRKKTTTTKTTLNLRTWWGSTVRESREKNKHTQNNVEGWHRPRYTKWLNISFVWRQYIESATMWAAFRDGWGKTKHTLTSAKEANMVAERHGYWAI